MNENEEIAGKAFLEFAKIAIEDFGLSAPTPEILKLIAENCKPESGAEKDLLIFLGGYFLGAGKEVDDLGELTVEVISEHAIQLLKEGD